MPISLPVSTHEMAFVKAHYLTQGAAYCRKHLGCSQSRLTNIRRRLGLRRDYASDVDVEGFRTISTPAHAYMLGFIWADGHLTKVGGIHIHIQKRDMDVLYPLFCRTGKWRLAAPERRRPGCQETQTLHKGVPSLCEFLRANGYKTDASRFVELISPEMKRYWYRGVLDGDGHIRVDTRHQTYRIMFASAFDENWSYLTSLLKEMRLPFSLDRRPSKADKDGGMHSASRLTITGKHRCKRFIEWVYAGADQDGLFLPRKRESAQKILAVCERRPASGYRGVKAFLTPTSARYAVRFEDRHHGMYGDPAEAARAYDRLAVAAYGERATTNFPLTDYLTSDSL